MIHAIKSLCQITENSSKMNFLVNGFKYTVSLKEHFQLIFLY